jgi:hypothetical protein
MAQGVVRSVSQNSSIFEEVELRLRTTIAAHSIVGYEVNFRVLSGGDCYIQIVRWNGPMGNFTLLNSVYGPGIHDGDVVKATIVGHTITAYINGNQLVQAFDSAITSGNPGMGFFNQNGAPSVDSDYGFKSFYAAELN